MDKVSQLPKPCAACSIHARGTTENKFKSVCSVKHWTADLSRLTADLTATGRSTRPRIGNDLPVRGHRMNCNWPESTLAACSTGEASKAPGHFPRPGYSFQMTPSATEPTKALPPRRAAFVGEYLEQPETLATLPSRHLLKGRDS
jgi:hypothetical protein